MVAIKLDLFLLLNTFYVSDSVRRIQGGATVQRDKPFMVYLVQAPISDKKYDEWLCGGVLVSTVFILTSAACVDDVGHMYAIAGYSKYVPDDEIETDKCTKEKKKKVVYTCVPVMSDSVRRIQGGATVQRDKPFMVYLVQAPMSDKKYDEWLCGGVLVSTVFILTSAACVDDVGHMYAIAGYSKYVPDDEIETDKCTKEKKKKVVYTCVPVNYELGYGNLEKWSYIDIALAKVESAYNLKDNTFKNLCTYTPTVISISYEERFQEPGTEAIVLGWGHKNIWRLPEDTKKYNQKTLNYASVRIIEKEPCKKEYLNYTGMDEVIDQFMICTFGKGLLDDKGKIVHGPENPPPVKISGCADTKWLTMHDILDDDEKTLVVDLTRKEGCLRSNQISNDSLKELENRTLFNIARIERNSFGICQNDHGGPLVAWVGGLEVVIGVASVFKVDADSRICEGPYLFTSTICSSAFLDCILSDPNETSRRSLCNSPPIQRGYDIVERHISWSHHPVGAAENGTLANVGDNGTTTTTNLVDNGTTTTTNLGDNGTKTTTHLGDNGTTTPTNLGDNGTTTTTHLGDNGTTTPTNLGDNGTTTTTNLGDNGTKTTTEKSKKHKPHGKVDKFWTRFRNQGLARKKIIIF